MELRHKYDLNTLLNHTNIARSSFYYYQNKIAPNILERNFKAAAPNQKWATYITEFNVSGNKLYLSPIIDLFNQEIVSYELTERPVFNQVVMMLKKHLRKYQTILI